MLIFTVCVFWVIFGSFGVSADGRPVTCCLKLGRSKPPLDRVLNYTIQTKRLCPITAVVIQTVYGKRLCSDPNSDWTKRAMWKVDGAKMKPREQDVVPAERTSAEGRRGRSVPLTAKRVATKQPMEQSDNKVEKPKTTTNGSHINVPYEIRKRKRKMKEQEVRGQKL